jgi:hypothetical protein
MKRTLRWTAGAALALVLTAAIVGLSRVPYQPPGGELATIRLSWRTPAEFREECREPTTEELERLPVHMRRQIICEGYTVPYRLRAELDGAPILDELVRPAGVRQDRPVYLMREIVLEPGEHTIKVSWASEPPPANGDEGWPPLEIDVELSLGAGEIALITYDNNERRLAARGNGIVRAVSR